MWIKKNFSIIEGSESYSSQHAAVLFDGAAAAEETRDEDERADSDHHICSDLKQTGPVTSIVRVDVKTPQDRRIHYQPYSHSQQGSTSQLKEGFDMLYIWQFFHYFYFLFPANWKKESACYIWHFLLVLLSISN